MPLVAALFPSLGVKLFVKVCLLQMLHPVDVDEDGLGLRCSPELQVHLADDIRDRVDALPLLYELPVCRPWRLSLIHI